MSQDKTVPFLATDLAKLKLSHLDTQLIKTRRNRNQTVNIPFNAPLSELSRAASIYGSDYADTLKQSTTSLGVLRENSLAPVQEKGYYYDAVAVSLQQCIPKVID